MFARGPGAVALDHPADCVGTPPQRGTLFCYGTGAAAPSVVKGKLDRGGNLDRDWNLDRGGNLLRSHPLDDVFIFGN